MDSILVAHEVCFSIPDEAVQARLPEWQKLTVGCKSRSDYVKGVLAFWGLELLEYDSAMIQRSIKTSAFSIEIISKTERERRLRAAK